MKVKVIKPFLDVFNRTVKHEVGAVLDVEASRAANLISRKLAIALEVETPTEKEEVKVESAVENDGEQETPIKENDNVNDGEQQPEEQSAETEEVESAPETDGDEKPKRGRPAKK